MKGLDGVGLGVTAVGGVLIFAGIKGYPVLAVVQNLVTGKPIGENVPVTNLLTTGGGTVQPVEDSSGAGPNAPGGYQSLGLSLASSLYGWEGAEWIALQKLWNRESSWNPKAMNPSSKAYGIPQALPYTKMPKKAWPESAGGKSDAETQIRWGLKYIKGRYSKPTNAWAHSEKYGWY